MQTFARSHKVLEASAQGLVHAAPPTGIGFLGANDGTLFVGNTDRNLQLAFPDLDSEKLHNIAIFYETAEPLTDERALLDLDFHNILFEKSGAFYAVNHLGIVRRFCALHESIDIRLRLQAVSAGGQTDYKHDCFAEQSGNDSSKQEQLFNFELRPQSRFQWIPDAERTYLVNNRLISSSSGDFKIKAPAKPGVFISMSLERFLHEYDTTYSSAAVDHLVTLPGTCHFEDLGFVTALFVDSQQQYLIFAAGQWLFLCSLIESDGVLIPGPIRWRQTLPFFCKLLFRIDNEVIASGYAPTSESEADYTSLEGGGIARLSLTDGSILLQAAFEMNPAWGNGATPVKYVQEREEMYCVDRFGSLYFIDHKSLEQQCIHISDHGKSSKPLGAGHLAFSRNVIFCGYNRGGYRLHCWML